ncbi:DUF6291 domain-containing protein [Capnocytophaga canimorsus]|uniref:DUF6291 domain-containing protein n=1 Tax=Capnocytophaga canimorsus TaxID=28188 RepID=UPI0037D40E13
MERDSFVVYKSFLSAIKRLKRRDIQGELALAIIEYGITGVMTECGEIVELAMELIKPQIEANNQKYLNGKKGAEHGKKGGRPKKETPEKPQENPNETPNEDVNDNVNDISFLEKKKQKTYTSDEGEILENSEKESLTSDLKNEDGKKKKVAAKKKKANPPEISEFLTYCEDLVLKNNLGDFSLWKFTLEAKYNAWADANWSDGNGKPIANWKTKIQNTLPFLKPINNGQKSNTTSNYTRANAGGGYPTGQKISARAFLAKQYSEQLARNREAGNITIEVETSPSE